MAEVAATTLFEAVAQAIVALRREEWVADIPRGQNVVSVSVANVRVHHQVKMADFERWLEKPGGTGHKRGRFLEKRPSARAHGLIDPSQLLDAATE